jgi:MFS family permease
MCAEGVAWSAMVGLGESYLPAFVLAMSANELAAGLVATAPMLFGAVLQLIAPWGVARLRSYRKWVIACAVIQALSFFPLIAMAVCGRISVGWTFLVASVYWATNLGMGPAWNAWAETLVPLRIRPRYFARRARLGQVGLLLGFAVGGVLLEGGTRVDRGVEAFATLFLLAAASRLTSAYFLRLQREPFPPAPSRTTRTGRSPLAGPTLRFVLAMQMATWIAGPYFTPYMLVHLGLSYSEFMFLTCTAFLAKVLVLPLMGDVCSRVGVTKVLVITGVSLAAIPILWVFNDSLLYLFTIQALGGAAWAGFELATLLLFFEKIPVHQRMGTLTLFNLANTLAITLGSFVGAVVLTSLGSTPGAYLTLFLCSGFARALSLVTLTDMRVPRMSSWRVVTRSLSMTPSVGSIDRPVLGTFDSNTRPALESAFDQILTPEGPGVRPGLAAMSPEYGPTLSSEWTESVSQ